MAVNVAYVGTPPGLIKILHIVLGVIAIGCGGHSFESEYVFERVFLWGTVTCFIVSILYFLVHLASDGVAHSQANKGLDVVYHIVGGILLIVGGSLMIASVKKYDKMHCDPLPWGPPCQERKGEKLAGGSFSIINGIFYFIAVALIGMQRQEEDDWDPRIRGYPSATKEKSEQTSGPRV